MGESEKHIILVNAIKLWINKNRRGTDNICFLVDSGINPPSKRPKKINGYIPDIFAENLSSIGMKWKIIGEAKTSRDLDTKHSEHQIKAFLQNCELNENIQFVLAVPWNKKRYAISLLKYFKKELNLGRVKTTVINELEF